MNERIRELIIESVTFRLDPDSECLEAQVCPEDLEHLVESVIAKCTAVLFDESERLYGLYSEEDNMGLADHFEICSNQCITDIALIEKYFGVEE